MLWANIVEFRANTRKCFIISELLLLIKLEGMADKLIASKEGTFFYIVGPFLAFYLLGSDLKVNKKINPSEPKQTQIYSS